ncbi:MAG: hypothetical protein ACREK3_05375 [Gemmatimonadota bacterium]
MSRVEESDLKESHDPSAVFTAHDGLHGLFREYLLGLVAARSGNGQAAEAHARRVAAIQVTEYVGSLAHDLAQGVRGHALRQQGRSREALEAFRRIRLENSYDAILWSPLLSLDYERFSLAEFLQELGREEEVLELYRNFLGLSISEIIYLGLTELRQAEIYEHRGDLEQAARHYDAFLELWRDSDPEFRPLVERARQSLARIQAQPGDAANRRDERADGTFAQSPQGLAGSTHPR